MENASKALIIAGAILISILLISVGIIVMNAVNDPVKEGADSAKSQAVEIFNAKFTGYTGTQSSTTVKSLFTAVNSAKSQHAITIKGVTKASDLDSKAEYKVDITKYDNDGYISEITIAKK